MRAELDELTNQTKREYELSTAVGVGPKAAGIDWKAAEPYLTNMFAMTYDFLGGGATNWPYYQLARDRAKLVGHGQTCSSTR